MHHPERVDGLVLACTTPGWPFAYPMPAASVRLIAATADMAAEAASFLLADTKIGKPAPAIT